MADETILTGDRSQFYAIQSSSTVSPVLSDTSPNVPPGTPLCANVAEGGEVVRAKADAAATAYAIGLAAKPGIAGRNVHTQFAGPLTLTEAQWDLITGQTGGLDPGVPYYLSAATAGKLTTTAPVVDGQFVTPIGVAFDTTSMLIQLNKVEVVGVADGAVPGAMFFGLTAGTGNGGSSDYAATVAVGAPVPFPQDGPTTTASVDRASPPFSSANSEFQVTATGIYEVSWAIAFLEASQLELAIVSAGPTYTPIANTCTLSGAGTQINTNKVLVALNVNQVIALINPAGNAAALTVQTADGSRTHAQAPSLVIKPLGATFSP